MATFREIRTRPVQMSLIDGDRVVINWVFDFVGPDGRAFTLDEVAVQRWRGDRIAEEHFYYDISRNNIAPMAKGLAGRNAIDHAWP